MNGRFSIHDEPGGGLPDDATLARYRSRRAPAGLAERIVREAGPAAPAWRRVPLPSAALAACALLVVVITGDRWSGLLRDGGSPVVAGGPTRTSPAGLRLGISVPTMTSISMLPAASRPPGALRSVPLPGPSMKFSFAADVTNPMQRGDGNEDS